MCAHLFFINKKLEKEKCLHTSLGAGAGAKPDLGHPAGTVAPPRPGGKICLQDFRL